MNSSSIEQTVNHLFRQEAGKMVAVLTKLFGAQNLELAEDVVQEALISALETWKFKGLPDNPRAWLYRVAKNRAIDIIRREKYSNSIDFNDPGRLLLTSGYTLQQTMNQFWNEDHIRDDFLAMMFACCHPEISPEKQVTFILKILCGFSTKEIARAFLTGEDTVSKRLYRTREFFRKQNIKPEIPSGEAVTSRLAAVLDTIYLLFNEGYSSTDSPDLIRKDLISQALALCKELTLNKKTQFPEVYALMSLMCFQTAKSESRISVQGEMIMLPEQDRSKWDHALIGAGNDYLNKAAFGERISVFHIEAAIAFEHCTAKDFASTNWHRILEYYNLLYQLSPSPVTALNRAIAIMELQGPKKALASLEELENKKSLEKYYLYYSLLGELYLRTGNIQRAHANFKKAISLTRSEPERRFLEEKLNKISKPEEKK